MIKTKLGFVVLYVLASAISGFYFIYFMAHKMHTFYSLLSYYIFVFVFFLSVFIWKNES